MPVSIPEKMSNLARREYQLAVLRHQQSLIELALYLLHAKQNKKRRQRRHWVRPWITRRPHFGLFDQLMVELRNEDQASFTNFMRMPPAMFDELLNRVGPRIAKQYTRDDVLEPGLKLALTLRHLASGNTYASMKFAWRVPHCSRSVRSGAPSPLLVLSNLVCVSRSDRYHPCRWSTVLPSSSALSAHSFIFFVGSPIVDFFGIPNDWIFLEKFQHAGLLAGTQKARLFFCLLAWSHYR